MIKVVFCFFTVRSMTYTDDTDVACEWNLDLVRHERGDGSADLMVRLGFAFGSKQDE